MNRSPWALALSALHLSALHLSACSAGDDHQNQMVVTGSPEATIGLPRYRAADRFLVEGCCTLRLGPDERARPGQGIDSTIYDIAGPGYALSLIFGPYEPIDPGPGYVRAGRRVVDKVELVEHRRDTASGAPTEAALVWTAEVGGKKIGNLRYAPPVLVLRAQCATPIACRRARKLVATLRF